jgi:hypothetical protein
MQREVKQVSFAGLCVKQVVWHDRIKQMMILFSTAS